MKILIAILIAVIVAELELALRSRRRGIPGARALLWTASAQIGIPVAIITGFLLVKSVWPEAKQPGSWWFSPREGTMLVALFWSQVSVMAAALGLSIWISLTMFRRRKQQPTKQCTLSAGAAEA